MPGLAPPNTPVRLFNVRYGIQMVAPIAVFIAILAANLRLRKLPGLGGLAQMALLGIIVAQTVVVATGGIVTVQDGQYGISCAPEHPISVYLAQHYAGGKVLEDVYATNIDGEEAGVHFSDIIYEGSGQLWTDALKNPAGTADWVIVHADNLNDPVFTHINIYGSAFNSQFTLVVQEFGKTRLYHRNGLAPLPTRPVPPGMLTEHQLCNDNTK